MGPEPGAPAAQAAWAQNIFESVIAPFQLGPFGTRFHVSAFVVFLIVAVVLYLRRSDRTRTFLAHLFPREIYFTQSSLVDLKVYVARHFVSFSALGLKILSVSAVAAVVSGLILAGTEIPETAELAGWRWWACLLAVALAYDLGGYWLHRVSHENGLVWPFHKLHHSAEGLTPLTVARVHPVYELLGSFFVPLTVGPVLGVIFALFGEQDLLAVTAVNASYAVFHLAGSNLRHSHFWIGYGPVLSRIFVSPAMHQIHHSVETRHWNKNYGEIFALWDWAFGTLYAPRGRETFAVGVERLADGTIPQPHPTLRAAFVGPFLEAGAEARRLAGRLGAPEPRADAP